MSKTHFSEPRYYRIEVEGKLPQGWFDRLGSMRVFSPSQEMSSIVTIMEGRVADQADLSGILNTLYELHLTLQSVKYITSQIPSKDDTI